MTLLVGARPTPGGLACRCHTAPMASRARARTRGGASFAAVVAVLALGACQPDTVTVRFDPSVGDEFRFRSEVSRDVTTVLDGVPRRSVEVARLDALHHVTDVDADEVAVDVTVTRDGTSPRRFEVTVDRSSRLSAIDIVEGVPAEALGIDVGPRLPSDITRPPEGQLEPGTRWRVLRTVTVEEASEPLVIRGEGRIVRLGHDDGTDVVVAEVTLEVPVQSIVDTEAGLVRLIGTQRSIIRTAYSLVDGAVWHESSTVRGALDVSVEPPAGVVAPSVEGTISYRIATDTARD